jgi:hypothetical protein
LAHRQLKVTPDHIAAGPGYHSGKGRHADALVDKSYRAVAEDDVYASGVEAVDLTGTVGAEKAAGWIGVNSQADWAPYR